MIRRTRSRRGPYAVARPSVVPSIIRSLILLAIVGVLLYLLGSWIVWLFSSGNSVQRAPITMTVERGNVMVALDGGLLQRAEGTLKLYGGDRVTTGNNGNAAFTAFEGTSMRIDTASDITIEESNEGTEESEILLRLDDGAVWINTPEATVMTGAVSRAVHSGQMTVFVPPGTEMVIEEQSMLVFKADGVGVSFTIDGRDESFTLGEGQQLSLPADTIDGDIYSYRSAIDPLAIQSDFIQKSRMHTMEQGSGSMTDDVLTVTKPEENAVINGSTVLVEGFVQEEVARVRINGYDTTPDLNGNFSQEIVMEEDELQIRIEALDEKGLTLEQATRSLRKGSISTDVRSPTITSPANAGQTYRTQSNSVTISGTAPLGTTGIIVNDYKLQLYKAGSTTWSYIASTELGNLKNGTNVYNIYALDAAGKQSPASTLTIIVGAGTTGTVDDTDTTGESAQISETSLPQNSPLQPGALKVTGPKAGTSFTVTGTGTEFLLEGTTSSATDSMWVNGYRLQLFKAGNTYWNYIVSTRLSTLKKGTNTYKVNARDKDGKIIDTVTYTIEY